jgi:hypothetical protein
MLNIRIYNAVFDNGVRYHVKVARDISGHVVYRIFSRVESSERKLPSPKLERKLPC